MQEQTFENYPDLGSGKASQTLTENHRERIINFDATFPTRYLPSTMSDIQIPRLRDDINRGLDYGCFDLTKANLLEMCDGDLALAFLALKQWETRGLLEIILNPNLANDDEICIRMLNYIDKESPWPNFPQPKG